MIEQWFEEKSVYEGSKEECLRTGWFYGDRDVAVIEFHFQSVPESLNFLTCTNQVIWHNKNARVWAFGIEMHSRTFLYKEDEEPLTKDCGVLGNNPCYFDGSGLHGDAFAEDLNYNFEDEEVFAKLAELYEQKVVKKEETLQTIGLGGLLNLLLDSVGE